MIIYDHYRDINEIKTSYLDTTLIKMVLKSWNFYKYQQHFYTDSME